MESKEAQGAETTAVAAQAMEEEKQQAVKTREQNREEATRKVRAAQASTMWASIKSRVRATSESAILRTRQMFGEPKVESTTVEKSAAKAESA
ncbi:hypothetical protein PR202_ga27037 [Eleusine coracana subsp. coracana]|uniref:Uncharacterized protein n=1 Tax=Eleusine coracana subsp. coracana TaxID=191504 RepID=A0AAV5DFN8_ELECO|nr:hypothetical protein PR202_ga27037 [Eleusine coracana subsp. coracana]